MKRKVGRPKGSISKKQEISEPICNVTKLALNQVDQLNAIKNLEIVVNNLVGHLNSICKRVSDLESPKVVSTEDKISTADVTLE